MIESNGNSQIKRIVKLKNKAKFRRDEQCFVVEGWRMVEEALSRNLVQSLYVSKTAESDWEKHCSLERSTVNYEVISDKLFRELSDTVSPQGVLAMVSMPRYEAEKFHGENAKLLCLEDIQDPGNLGTMIRTAEGAGMTAVVLSKGCVDLFNPKVVRSTMGALFRVPFYVCDDMLEEVKQLQEKGFSMYAAHLQGENDYTQETYQGKVGILIGNEGNGLSPEVSERADKKVKIPMEGQLESLNAAVSAALFMYEVRRNVR